MNSSGSAVTLKPDGGPVAAIQAYYYHVTGKTEKFSQQFKGEYDISFEDLRNLHRSMAQYINTHNVIAFDSKVNVYFEKDEKINHSSFEKFSSFDFSRSKPVSSILYEIEFAIKHPSIDEDSGDLQRYKMSIRINQNTEDASDIPFFMRRAIIRPITITVDFVDFAIARAITGVMKDWIDSLSEFRASKFLEGLSNSDDILGLWTPRIIAIIPFLVLISFYWPVSNQQVMQADIINIMVSLSAMVIMYSFGQWSAHKISEWSLQVLPRTFVAVGEGDKKLRAQCEKKAANFKRLIGFMLGSVLLAVALNLLASLLYDHISK